MLQISIVNNSNETRDSLEPIQKMGNQMKSVTVLVSVKNKQDMIEKCIKSLLNMDYSEKKLLIIDNMSTDDSFGIMKRFEGEIELHQVAGGLSRVFNWALSKIDTDYVAFTDADCVVDKDWLRELLKPFEREKDIIATAGYCGSPQELPALPTMIGLELESRFKKFPRYITRAPTMNLCVKTEFARKARFDEQQMVAVETDFGYRLTEMGKMLYVPTAKVLHYHRASWGSYFNQQKDYAKWHLRVLLKHKGKALGDHISTATMTLQIPLFVITFVFFIFSIFSWSLLIPGFLSLFALIGIYLKSIRELVPFGKQSISLIGLFGFRNLAWVVGIAEGMLRFSKDFALGNF